MNWIKLFLSAAFLVLPGLSKELCAAPQVIVAGKSYASIDEYRAREQSNQDAPAESPGEASLAPSDESALKLLNAKGYEQSMRLAISAFKQNWDDPLPKFYLKRDELAERIRALAGDRPQPVLVIAEKDKLRVMALEGGDEIKD